MLLLCLESLTAGDTQEKRKHWILNWHLLVLGSAIPSFLSEIICFRIFCSILEQGALITAIWKYCYKFWNKHFLYANRRTTSAPCKTIPDTQHSNSACFVMIFQWLSSKKGMVLGQSMTCQRTLSLHLCTAAHKKQKSEKLCPIIQPLFFPLGSGTKENWCVLWPPAAMNQICYWIKTPTLGGKLQKWSWMTTACHFPWTQNPQLWETERSFPNGGDRNLEVQAWVQELRRQGTCHNITHLISYWEQHNLLLSCSCNSPHPRSSCMKLSTAMMPCGHLKAT